MSRHERSNGARIMLVGQDNSVRLVSAVTGAVLTLAYPSMNNSHIHRAVYDTVNGSCSKTILTRQNEYLLF